MKKIVLALLMAVSISAQARLSSVRVDAAVTNLTAVNNLPNNKVLVNTVLQQVEGVAIDNRSAAEVVVNCPGVRTNDTADPLPETNSVENIYIGPGSTFTLDNALPGRIKYCFIRTISGTLSSGIITITVKGAK